MIEHTLDKAHSICMCDLSPSLSKPTLSNSRQRFIPHIEERGALAGLIIEVAAFPGWDSFGAWRAISALCAIITSRSKRSSLCPIRA